jgi:16S rRNA (guanine966-N2)-methyltransferase
VRVIAGELGGRRLAAPKGHEVRPTSDRAREALFSILGDVSGSEVLDLFCGTGALGIEALSRGASRAVLVDTETAPALANVEALAVRERTEVVRRDAASYLETTESTFDLILCDPPYRLAAPLAPTLEQLVPKRLRDHGRLVVESPARSPIQLPFELATDRVYGEASLRIWRIA